MKNHSPLSTETLSALADGRLDSGQPEALTHILADPQALQTWHLYHMVGDVLRSEALAPSVRDLAFWERLEVQLAEEMVSPAPAVDAVARQVPGRLTAANAPVLRWQWVAGLAFATLAGVVGSGMWNRVAPETDAALAAAPAVQPALPQLVAVDTANETMIRDPQLDALMAAHQQLGGHSALQMPSGFLRNATFERPVR